MYMVHQTSESRNLFLYSILTNKKYSIRRMSDILQKPTVLSEEIYPRHLLVPNWLF